MYKYDQPTHSLIQLPEMKEPDIMDYQTLSHGHRVFLSGGSEDNYYRVVELWAKQKANCKTYPVGVEKVPDYWKVEGQILEEEDFRIVNVCEDGQRCECNKSEAERCLYSKFVAIPIQEENKGGVGLKGVECVPHKWITICSKCGSSFQVQNLTPPDIENQLSELETFKDAYIERNDAYNKVVEENEHLKKQIDLMNEQHP